MPSLELLEPETKAMKNNPHKKHKGYKTTKQGKGNT